MSDFELISIVLMILGILLPLLVAYIDERSKGSLDLLTHAWQKK